MRNTFSTTSTFRSKHAVIIVDTVNLIVNVNGEWNAVQALVTHTAAETAGMV